MERMAYEGHLSAMWKTDWRINYNKLLTIGGIMRSNSSEVEFEQ